MYLHRVESIKSRISKLFFPNYVYYIYDFLKYSKVCCKERKKERILNSLRTVLNEDPNSFSLYIHTVSRIIITILKIL